ncbi:hypothetical protein [Clostridium estertheticum]|uniref:Amphi-Trp domain-containing protein n=1 Tax=Clostridium estertheticum subsp. estertheticum TaxID=1552 RepID=A0A1J0GHG0_9CLOT|nr:hypothetical protein [Clostridium estertheticum]APC40801.1 hypothetical protein A7L45_12300 [Clostridium estertheticum subsp. estertheticum]MBU3074217.1 hypothetical protein [Clostridium estertheticum]MBU3164311.1 hypothetical protein [Clostridium estertheticum]MBZ9617355.1 hypothetical protein [Clostridium estertheticum subsp. laramiense]WAG73041.1 hypothetical protein LL032_18110 [Clostridium estertheticum]
MDYREKYTGNKEKFYFFLKDEVIRLFKDKLKIDGALVNIPDDEELNYQFKLDSDENYGDFTIKVTWGQKPKQTKALEEDINISSADEFEEKTNINSDDALKEDTNINSDGMKITTDVSFDYEPFEL